MQINRWLHLSSSLWTYCLLLRLVQKKNRPKKIFYCNKQLNCISCLMICKTFFWYEFPDILEKSWRRRKKKQANEKHFAFKENTKKD